MMKFFLTALLFLFAILVTALDKSDFDSSITDDVNLSVGIEKPDFRFVWDLTKPHSTGNWIRLNDCIYIPARSTDSITHPNLWYSDYFANAPFDGNIEPLVVGEPLPSPLMTLLLAFGVAGIIYSYHYKSGSVA